MSHGVTPPFRLLFRFAWWVLGAGAVPAQAAGLYFNPSLTLSEVYDDNILYSSSNPQSDVISRFTPVLNLGYDSRALSINADYDFDAEVYPDHPALDDALLRQRASLAVRHHPTRNLDLSLDGAYTKTRTPGELNLDTGFQEGRASATRLALGGGADYRFSPVLTGTASYGFTRDELTGGADTDTHEIQAGLDREFGRRDVLHAGYSYRRFLFSVGGNEYAQVPSIGWTHKFTPGLATTVTAGPRFSDRHGTDADVALEARLVLRNGDLSARYVRGLSTLVGEGRTVKSQTIAASWHYRPRRSLEFSVSPGYSSLSGGGVGSDVYYVSAAATYTFNEFVTFLGSYDFTTQHGHGGAILAGELDHNTVLIGVKVDFVNPFSSRREHP